jgi:hypothetical protein
MWSTKQRKDKVNTVMNSSRREKGTGARIALHYSR